MLTSKIEIFPKQFQSLMSKIGADRFLSWWLKELSALMPAWMHMPSDKADQLILLEMNGSTVVLKQMKQGKWLEAGSLERNGVDLAAQRSAFLALLKDLGKQPDETGILLASPHLLRKRVKLPLAVEENLAQALRFEMDRYTPFKGDQVYFDYKIIDRSVKTGQLEVQLVLAPKQVVDEMLALLKTWGANAQGVWLADELSAMPPRANLLPLALRAQVKSPQRHVNLALASLAGILLFAAIVIPVWQKYDLALRLAPLADQARQQAEAADALHRELDKQMAEYNHLLEKKQTSPIIVALLDELSRLLPDNTWVQQLDLKDKELQIQGETASSSQLVGIFEQSKILRNASFKSPLTKTQAGERFHLAIEVNPMQPPEADKTKPQQSTQPDSASAPQNAASMPPPTGSQADLPDGPAQQSSSPASAVAPKAPPASATPLAAEQKR